MQAIVNGYLAVSLFPPGDRRLPQRLAWLGGDKVQDGGRPPAGSGDGAGSKIVGGDDVAHRQAEVDVGVHETREDVMARGVNDLPAGETVADASDLFTLHTDVSLIDV